jgi:hypothetical protein
MGRIRALGRIQGSVAHRIFPIARNFPDLLGPALTRVRSRITVRAGSGRTLGLATAPGAANAVLVIRTPPESGHTIYDTFDDEKRVI